MTAEHVQLRPEEPGDAAAIGAVITAAFAQPAEAELVARLRAAQALTVSQVACRDGRIRLRLRRYRAR